MSDETVADALDLDVSPPDDERRWLVCFDEDYDDVMIDRGDNVALLVDADQAGEILRLASTAIASMAGRDDEPIEYLIEKLQEVSDD